MKHFIFILVVLLSFCSCNQPSKEETFRMNVSKIYYKSSTTELFLKEDWTWKNNLLSNIDYYHNSFFQSKKEFDYNADSVLIEVVENNITATYSYQASLLDKVAFSSSDGEAYKNIRFIYNNGKISRIETTYNNDSLNHEYIELEWKGNNISKASFEALYDSLPSTFSYTYQYDDKINPFKGCLDLNKNWYELFSANNLCQSILSEDGENGKIEFTTNYTYTYYENYPTEKSYTNGNYHFTYYYVYE